MNTLFTIFHTKVREKLRKNSNIPWFIGKTNLIKYSLRHLIVKTPAVTLNAKHNLTKYFEWKFRTPKNDKNRKLINKLYYCNWNRKFLGEPYWHRYKQWNVPSFAELRRDTRDFIFPILNNSPIKDGKKDKKKTLQRIIS